MSNQVKMKYFDEYCRLVDEGKIPLCEEMQLAVKRIKRFKKQYIFRQDKSDKAINFIESECSNTKGVKSRLQLALPQKVWIETAFGFFYEKKIKKINPSTMEEYYESEERRLIHEVPLIIARGSGKTTLASAIGSYGQIADGEYGADIQLLANTREQASYLFNSSREMTNFKQSLLYLMKKGGILSSTKQGMLYRPLNALMSIKTSNYDVLDGTNAHMNIFDEVAQYKEDFIQVVNDGSSRKRKNWMTWYITTNGVLRDAVFDRYYDEWIKILKDVIKDDTVMPFIYKLDDVSEVRNPKCWQKAMPMLGITTDEESILRDIERAKNDPVKQQELMAKTFNLPTNSYLSYFTNEECEGNKEQFDIEMFTGSQSEMVKAILGLDLSDVNDICSCSMMLVSGDKRFFIARKYLPRKRIDNLPQAQKEQYLRWEEQGLIKIHELDYNDQSFIFEDLNAFMLSKNIYPVAVGYDKWNAREIKRKFDDYYGDICKEIPQTVKGLSQGLKIYKEKIQNGNIIFNDSLMSWCHANVQVKTDANGNIFPNKAKSKNKIDVFASNLDAFICYENNKTDLEYYFG